MNELDKIDNNKEFFEKSESEYINNILPLREKLFDDKIYNNKTKF